MPPSTYDLHCHSTASDGKLRPSELINLAVKNNIRTLALTDHDTVNGLVEAASTADANGINLVPGIELSTTWNDKCFHIVGLNIDPQHPALKQGISDSQNQRIERAKLIAAKLTKQGIGNGSIYETIKEASGEGMITRTHFAQYLVDQGYGRDLKSIFKHYLVRGKPGFVATKWPNLDDVVSWINDAGGQAIIAHPMRYKLTGSWMRKLLFAFKQAGGTGIEVVCGNNSTEDTRHSAAFARRYQLAGSVGSDFHSPENSWSKLGNLARLPDDIEPIWRYWEKNSV